jgi:hypothetical protein
MAKERIVLESDSDDTTDESERIELLQIALAEQRRFHDELTASYRGLRNKILYFIGAILAVMTFLYAGATDDAKSVSERLFIPSELYGVIFYFFGLFCLIYALFTLVKGARPDTQWNVPTDTIEEHVIGKVNSKMRQADFLQEIVDEYETSSKLNLTVHGNKSEAIRSSFFPLLIGAIILVVLRFFQ